MQRTRSFVRLFEGVPSTCFAFNAISVVQFAHPGIQTANRIDESVLTVPHIEKMALAFRK